jgi:hypothetical protein
MTTRSIRERISEDVIPGAKKLSNLDFGNFKTTRSCYVCAIHHPQNKGLVARLLGRYEFFCSQACKEKIFKPRTGGSTQSLA